MLKRASINLSDSEGNTVFGKVTKENDEYTIDGVMVNKTGLFVGAALAAYGACKLGKKIGTKIKEKIKERATIKAKAKAYDKLVKDKTIIVDDAEEIDV